jgi:predicted unusual protein kinase regulating ubiquinone biosynthesis (AarF/ABC1/UbiB family)
VDERGDLVIFDVGLVKEMPEDLLLQFTDFSKCLVMGQPQDFVNHMQRFHSYATDVNWKQLEVDMTGLLAKFRGASIGDLELGVLLNDLFAMARQYRVRPLPEMALVLHPETNFFQEIGAYLMPILAKRGLTLAPVTAAGG